jgi:uncharacterized membrane protein
MKNTRALRSHTLAKQLAFSALFAALCFVSTFVITVPLPNGYFNTGDVFVLLSGWFLGPIYGAVAAAVGSALADVLSGFAFYAPATFFIKGMDAALAWLVWKAMKTALKKPSLDCVCRGASAIAAETFMVLGYFLFESALYTFAGGAVALLGNTLQGVLCGVCATVLCIVFYRIPAVKKLFPAFDE